MASRSTYRLRGEDADSAQRGAHTPGRSPPGTFLVRTPSGAAPAARVEGQAAACAPRPSVRLGIELAGENRLQAVVDVTISAALPANALQTIRFGTVTHGVLDGYGRTDSPGNFEVGFPPGIRRTEFHLRRTSGDYVFLPLVVVDGCGDWPTFIGSGLQGLIPTATPSPTPTFTPPDASTVHPYVNGHADLHAHGDRDGDPHDHAVVDTHADVHADGHPQPDAHPDADRHAGLSDRARSRNRRVQRSGPDAS